MPSTRYRLPAAFSLALIGFLSSVAAPDARLNAAENWSLRKGHQFPAPARRKPRLRVDGQNLSGSTGCNSFTATLDQLPKGRVAIKAVTLTRMLCEPKQHLVETSLVRALNETEFLARQGKTLSFLSSNRTPLLIWQQIGKRKSARLMRRTAHAQRRVRSNNIRVAQRAAYVRGPLRGRRSSRSCL